MPPPKPPSRIDPLSFPVFGLSWYGSPTGDSILAYGGGGGSSKTGVVNKIVVAPAEADAYEISTGNDVAVGLLIHQNPKTQDILLYAAVGSEVQIYKLPSPQKRGPEGEEEEDGEDNEDNEEGSPAKLMCKYDVEDQCAVVTVNPLATVLAVGCLGGKIHVFALSERFQLHLLHTIEGHDKDIAGLCFALRAPLLLSSAKDGTARVWRDGKAVATLTCDVSDPAAEAKNKNKRKSSRPQQVLVRGCSFGDLEGKIVYTVASTKRSRAFLSRWVAQSPKKYVCQERTLIHEQAVSAMKLSEDGGLMALGGVNGTIILFDVPTWKVLKTFPEIHDFPVTCIAARPFPTPLRGEDDGVQIHAISASADSRMGVLTLMRRSPKRNRGRAAAGGGVVQGGPVGKALFYNFLYMAIIAWILYQVGLETMEICQQDLSWECFRDQVLIAPTSRPGILVPPH